MKPVKRRAAEPVASLPTPPPNKRLRGGDGVETAEKAASRVRLCQIYLRDVLSFIEQPKVEKCRTVSRALNAAVLSGYRQSALPRRHFRSLSIFTCDDNEFNLTKDGFVSGAQKGVMREGTSWTSMPQFRNCCAELIDPRAGPLVGQLIFPSKAASVPVCVRFSHKWDHEAVTFRAPNLLTEKTAFALGHLAHHLWNATFAKMEIEVRPRHSHLMDSPQGQSSGGGARLLNPAIARLFDVSTERLVQGPWAINRIPTPLDATCVETVRQVGRFRCVESHVNVRSRLDEVMGMLTGWRRYCRQAHFKFGIATADFIDDLIGRLETLDATRFRSLVPSVTFTSLSEIIGWPARCNEDRLAGSTVKGRTTAYTFAFAHEQDASKKFTLELISPRQGRRLKSMKLDILVE